MTPSEQAAGAVTVEELVRRLIEIPADFLAEPVVQGRGRVEVAAVVNDLFVAEGCDGLDDTQAEALAGRDRTQRNWLQTVLIATWMLQPVVHDDTAPAVLEFMMTDLAGLAELVDAPRLVDDPDRREELVRLGLRRLDVLPAGETAAQAADRLATLDSVNQQRVMAQAREAEERARAVREALVAKRAAEAAAKATRE